MNQLTHKASVVYGYLFPQMMTFGYAIPSIEKICKECNLMPDKVKDAVTELVKEKYITVTIERTNNPFKKDKSGTPIVVNWTHYRLVR
jgi:hypothetical protein